MQLVEPSLRNALANLIATGAILDPAKVFVGVGVGYTDNGSTTTLADITLPTGALLATKPLAAWSAVYDQIDGGAAVDGPLLHFVMAPGDLPQTLKVWYLADAATAGNLIAYDPIQPPVALANEHQEFGLVPRIKLNVDGIQSISEEFSGV